VTANSRALAAANGQNSVSSLRRTYVIGNDFSPRVVTGTRAEQILADIRGAG
jgi:hypothetical protein